MSPSGRIAAAAALAMLAAGPALAWCEDAGSTMVELKDCLAEVQQAVDVELALVWNDVQQNIAGRDFLEPTVHARYAAAADRAHAAWKAWREAECREVTGYDWWGGSGAGAAIRSCLIETAAARVRDLTLRYDLDRGASPISHAGER